MKLKYVAKLEELNYSREKLSKALKAKESQLLAEIESYNEAMVEYEKMEEGDEKNTVADTLNDQFQDIQDMDAQLAVEVEQLVTERLEAGQRLKESRQNGTKKQIRGNGQTGVTTTTNTPAQTNTQTTPPSAPTSVTVVETTKPAASGQTTQTTTSTTEPEKPKRKFGLFLLGALVLGALGIAAYSSMGEKD